MTTIRLATRGSALALVQARHARVLLLALEPGLDVDIVIIQSTGDRSHVPFAQLSGVGVFVKELEDALLDGRADLAVHSLKDLPTLQPAGLEVVAVLEREDPRDALITRTGGGLASLPQAARVATSSPRREAQLRHVRPDLVVVGVRGNVDTRIGKLRQGEFDALVLALAGLRRLGRAGEASEVLSLETMLPAPGQGAVAIEAAAGSPAARLASRMDHAPTHRAVVAERTFLLSLGGGCSIPVGAHAGLGGGQLVLTALVADPASGRLLRLSASGSAEAAQAIGESLARQALQAGARDLLEATFQKLPLHGLRVAVTRASGQDEELAGALRAQGAEVVACPAIEIVPPRDPEVLQREVAAAAGYDLVAFTSANAVRAFFAAADIDPRAVRAAAVGVVTAAALRRSGCEPFVVARVSSGEGLGSELREVIKRGQRVLFPRASDARSGLAMALRDHGAEVVEVEAYRKRTPAALGASLREILNGDRQTVFTFLSPSAVENAMRVLADSDRDRLEQAVVASIGPTTTAAARRAGLQVQVEAASPTVAALVAALAAHAQGTR